MSNNESVYAPPKSCAFNTKKQHELTADGQFIVVRSTMPWIACCYRCNEPTRRQISIKVNYVPSWVGIFFVAGVLGGTALLSPYFPAAVKPFVLLFSLGMLIAVLCLQKTLRLKCFICDKHFGHRRRFIIGRWLAFTVYLLGAIDIITTQYIDWQYWLYVILAVMLVVAYWRYTYPNLTASHYQDGLFWIKGTGQAFRDSLPPLH